MDAIRPRNCWDAALRTLLARVMLSLACCCFLSGDPALAQKPAPQKAAGKALTIDAAEMQKP